METNHRTGGGSQSAAWIEQGTVPRPAALLGAAGLLPFVAITVAVWLASPDGMDWLTLALVGYGAVILSFLGAVHWGLAMRDAGAPPWRWYALGVLPALVGWGAMLLPPLAALAVLFAAFAGAFAIDRMAVEARLAPAWYRRLRRPLTVIVMASIALGASGIWFVTA